MIPQASITQWGVSAPWPTPAQIEQDLLLSRLMLEIADHKLLGPELGLRGGTCLHKLHLCVIGGLACGARVARLFLARPLSA